MAAMNNPARLVDAAGITVELRRGGSGAPLLVIHGELGVPGWLEELCASRRAPRHDRSVASGLRPGRPARTGLWAFTTLPPGLPGSRGMSICARR